MLLRHGLHLKHCKHHTRGVHVAVQSMLAGSISVGAKATLAFIYERYLMQLQFIVKFEEKNCYYPLQT